MKSTAETHKTFFSKNTTSNIVPNTSRNHQINKHHPTPKTVEESGFFGSDTKSICLA